MRNLIVATTLLLLLSAPAFAQAPSQTPTAEALDVEPVPPPTMKKWYGWQILLFDAATFAVAAGTETGEIALGWIATGAIVHGAHGNGGRAVGSVLMRVLAPIAGVYMGIAAEDCSGSESDDCGIGGAIVGFGLGMLTAEIIDVAMATEVVADDSVVGRALASASRRGVTPTVQARDGRVGLGLAGRF